MHDSLKWNRSISRRTARLAFAAGLLGATLAIPGIALAQPKTPAPAGDKKATVERSEEVNLAVGENKTVGAADTKSYSEGAPGIADAKLTTDKNQFVITGQKPGTTTLLLIKNDGTQVTYVINVFARPPAAVERELEQLLEGMTGLRVRRVGARFFIEGGVASEADARKIGQIAVLYPGQVESLVQVGATAGADRKFNIRLDFFFVQFQKTSSYQLGISYPSQIGGTALQSQVTYDFIAGATTSAQASIQNQALPGLDIAARAGWARVMKQSTVITANGTEATFENGGEQNFQVSAGLTTSIQSIQFGTKVVVLPRYDQNKRELEVALKADVADLTPPRTGSTILPGRQTAKLATLVHMKLGQSLILSGIRTRSQTRDSVGLPLLSEIPVLGALFGTQASQKEDVEGAVFIVPSVVESASKGALDMIKAALSQYQDYSGDLDSVNLYNKKPPVPTDDKLAFGARCGARDPSGPRAVFCLSVRDRRAGAVPTVTHSVRTAETQRGKAAHRRELIDSALRDRLGARSWIVDALAPGVVRVQLAVPTPRDRLAAMGRAG